MKRTMCYSEAPYVIAETSYNHQGDIKYLIRMIDEISELNLNAVKFHLLLNSESYMVKNHPLFNETKKWIFNEEQWSNILNYSSKKGLDVIALCDDVESIEYLIRSKKPVSAIELHAVALNDHFLLDAASKFDGHVLLGIGGSSIDEMSYAIEFLRRKKKHDIILMYGFQSYPTKYEDINLSKMMKIRALFQLPIGYADHTGFDDPNNELISVAAAIMGFWILEKHYTLDYGKKRIDYHAAVGKKQMENIKNLMEIALNVHGHGDIAMSDSERDYGNIGPMKKAIVAKKDISKGELLSLDNLWFKRTAEESTIKQNQLLQLIGCKTKQDIKKDEIIDFSKIEYVFKDTCLESFTNI